MTKAPHEKSSCGAPGVVALTDLEIEKLGPLAQQVSKFDAIDRNLIRTAATHIIDMIEEKTAALRAAESLKVNTTGSTAEDESAREGRIRAGVQEYIRDLQDWLQTGRANRNFSADVRKRDRQQVETLAT